MGKITYNDRAKRPPAFFEKLILVSHSKLSYCKVLVRAKLLKQTSNRMRMSFNFAQWKALARLRGCV